MEKVPHNVSQSVFIPPSSNFKTSRYQHQLLQSCWPGSHHRPSKFAKFKFLCHPTDYEERVLPSIVNEVTKAVVAQYNASELLTKRDLVSTQIRNMLVKRAGDFNILLDDVSITNLAFSTAYSAAVEAKQVAQQDSERAKYIVERAIHEKRTIVIRAEGEAKSAMLIGAVSPWEDSYIS